MIERSRLVGMFRRLLLSSLVVAFFVVAAVATAQAPILPPGPDAPPPTSSPAPSTSSGSSGSGSSGSSSGGSRYVPPATPSGPTQAEIDAQQAAAQAEQARQEAARLERERQAALRRERARQARILAARLASIQNGTASAVTAVSDQVDPVAATVPEPLPLRPPSTAPTDTGGGHGAAIAGVLAMLGALAVGSFAVLRHRTGGRRFGDRLGIGGAIAIDRRHVSIAIAAAFVVAAAVAAAVLAYLIVNPSAVG